jgi:ATP-dependent HslUV protease, peptidase subunit HslV
MSIIAALKKNGQIWVIADRQITWGYTSRNDFPDFSKVVRFKNALIGHAGTCIYGTALSYMAQKKPELFEAKFETKWDVLDFFSEYYTFLKDNFAMGGSKENDVSKISDSEFLVITKDKIFEVSSNRDLTEFNNFTAIGSGTRITLGAMHALNELLDDPAEILTRAYQACCKYDNYCGGEIELINVADVLCDQAAEPGEDLMAASGDEQPKRKTMTFIVTNAIKEKVDKAAKPKAKSKTKRG